MKAIRILTVFSGRALSVLLSTLVLLSGNLQAAPLKVGITLHPYYSYVANVVGDRAEIVPLVDAGFNPHSYELQPADLKRLLTMDALVLNGIGHDEFATHAVEKLIHSQPELKDRLTLINANKDVPLLAAANTQNAWNPHTFVSIDASIRQVYTIARELGNLDPDNARYFQKNAIIYARKLRGLKNNYMRELSGQDLSQVRIASTHNAYGYFLQEFGIGIDTVIEPAHGVEPSATQLQKTIDRIRKANVNLLFTELDMDNRYVSTIERATGIRLHHFSHMTYGSYGKDKVYLEMEQNLKTLSQALTEALSSDSVPAGAE
ncbi:metal ABC transporter solute-binding protein, Zn/Mn family [Oceanospirillum sediminis]|uniref:High-affinity zinc uptake system protein ZnuA n=1 Tax=Oceanospirillum sediminis TaxID=2760088 RepID=A0A839IM83_9GAMM|nr:zinc ABC transporter substrate-binding protein [Oceanospirillum sediminis]MBB1486335.1 zinc ABC transporter substrate-binding protein [Oceanospirillum sediminis]